MTCAGCSWSVTNDEAVQTLAFAQTTGKLEAAAHVHCILTSYNAPLEWLSVLSETQQLI
jgi:hypothetical protein